LCRKVTDGNLKGNGGFKSLLIFKGKYEVKPEFPGGGGFKLKRVYFLSRTNLAASRN